MSEKMNRELEMRTLERTCLWTHLAWRRESCKVTEVISKAQSVVPRGEQATGGTQ